MRILVISNFYPPAHVGGYEVLCAETVNCLREQHDVTVLTSNHKGLPSERGIVRELPYVPSHARSYNVRAPFAALTAARVTRRVLADVEPELVFVWNGAAIPQNAIRIAELSGAAVAYSVCEYWFRWLYKSDRFIRWLHPGQRGLKRVFAAAMRAFNRLPPLRIELDTRVPASICWVSDALRRAVEIPPTVEPLAQRVIYTGVHEPELWRQVERRPLADPPQILFVGRVEDYKGPDVAYRALAALRDRHGLDARLVLAGRGQPDMLATLDRLARELGIADRVELLGPLSHERVAQAMAESAAIVVPSTWQEPSGGICLEAGLARIPVVASRSGGMPEGLREEEHALYFDIRDHEGCADALARVLNDPADTAKRTARAFERANEFTFDRYMAQMNEFVDAAVSGHRRGPVGLAV